MARSELTLIAGDEPTLQSSSVRKYSSPRIWPYTRWTLGRSLHWAVAAVGFCANGFFSAGYSMHCPDESSFQPFFVGPIEDEACHSGELSPNW